MRYVIKLEEALMLALAIYGLYLFHAAWWWYGLMLLAPDISMLAYTAGNKAGAFCYNLFHHKAIAILLFSLGYWMDHNVLELAAIVLFGHASMDRVFGYGLKYEQGFRFTHLGKIGMD